MDRLKNKKGDLLHGWSMASLSEYLDTAQQSVGMNVVDSTEFFSPQSFKKALGWLATRVNGMSEDVVILTLIPMYLFFILNYRGLVLRFVSDYFQGERLEHMQQALHRSYTSIHEYLVGTAILTGVSALMTFLILFAFGIQYAFFFGVFLAVLNLIPFIGNLLGFVVILLFVWGTRPPEYALYIGIALYVSNIVQENFLRPILVGNKMEMNAAVEFSAVIVGGMVWGFSGMVLFIPMVGVVKAFIDSNPDWKSFGIFFESK